MPKEKEKDLKKAKKVWNDIFSAPNCVRVLVWIALIITIFSTIRLLFTPLFPTSEEYEGKFPENLQTNLYKWISEILPHRLMMFSESYNIFWILWFLTHVFFLLLLINIKKVVSEPPKPKELINNYLDWAIGSLLITIVFIAKWITEENVTQMGLGILSLAASTFVLLHYRITSQKSNK